MGRRFLHAESIADVEGSKALAEHASRLPSGYQGLTDKKNNTLRTIERQLWLGDKYDYRKDHPPPA